MKHALISIALALSLASCGSIRSDLSKAYNINQITYRASQPQIKAKCLDIADECRRNADRQCDKVRQCIKIHNAFVKVSSSIDMLLYGGFSAVDIHENEDEASRKLLKAARLASELSRLAKEALEL